MTSLARGLAHGGGAIAISAITACSSIMDLREAPEARVEVDPAVIRTIHYYAIDGEPHEPPSEVTTKRREDIDCLHTTPRECRLSETIEVTIHNTGSSTVLLHVPFCGGPLERYGKGDWHRMQGGACILIAVPPIEIAPGETSRTGDDGWGVSVKGMPSDEYRVKLPLSDGRGNWLPDDMRTSEPFFFQQPPDFEPFVCPTESKVELARELAVEELERAARGGHERGFESTILRLENEVPGIGGVYFDPDTEYWVVWITDESRSDAAAAAMQELLGDFPVHAHSPVHVQKGDYPFSELVGWSHVLSAYLVGIPGWHSLDAGEKLNRVRIGVANELATDDVECAVRGIGMPPGMAVVDVGP